MHKYTEDELRAREPVEYNPPTHVHTRRQNMPGISGYIAGLCLALVAILSGLTAPTRLQAQTLPFTPDAGDIVGGQPADPGEYPWQAFLLIGDFVCGGVLIHPQWVVTAAHCVWTEGEPVSPDTVIVLLGKHDILRFEPEQQVRNVAEVVVHPSYSEFSSDGDLALLRLATPAEFTARVGIIDLVAGPSDDPLVAPGINATATGWGVTDEDSTVQTDLLREVTVPIVSNQVCQTAMFVFEITDNHVCAGLASGGKDACFGDSGGPLIVPNTLGGWKLAGLTSIGIGCARPNTYGIYTRISTYRDWIRSFVRFTQITSLTPAAGRVGTVVAVQGSGFQEASAVNFGGAPAAFTLKSDGELLATVPPTAKTGPVVVTTPSETVCSSSDFQVTNTLALKLVGPVLGSVDIAAPAYTCSQSPQCKVDVPNGTALALSAEDTPDAFFIGWQEACTGAVPTCALSLDTDKMVQARFAPPTSSVTVTLSGEGGRITSPPNALDCGVDCSVVAATRSVISLTAEPDPGYVLTSWGGACTGYGPTCAVALYGDQAVTADFARATATLTVSLTGAGSGSVREQWGAFDCDPLCSAQFAPGMQIVLTAESTAGSVFTGWSGACSGGGDICRLTVTGDTTISARFISGWRLRLPALPAHR